jgi:hypothetical protein
MSKPVVKKVSTSENKMALAWPAVGPPRIPDRVLMTRNMGESPVRTADPQDVAASRAAAVRVLVNMRMRVIVLLTGPS